MLHGKPERDLLYYCYIGSPIEDVAPTTMITDVHYMQSNSLLYWLFPFADTCLAASFSIYVLREILSLDKKSGCGYMVRRKNRLGMEMYRDWLSFL